MISAFCYTKTLLRKILILPRVPAVFPFLRELNAIYHNLPQYWDKLRALQSYIEEPYKPPYTIFDLEERFAKKETVACVSIRN